jgi:hypothetical protein
MAIIARSSADVRLCPRPKWVIAEQGNDPERRLLLLLERMSRLDRRVCHSFADARHVWIAVVMFGVFGQDPRKAAGANFGARLGRGPPGWTGPVPNKPLDALGPVPANPGRSGLFE